LLNKLAKFGAEISVCNKFLCWIFLAVPCHSHCTHIHCITSLHLHNLCCRHHWHNHSLVSKF